VLVDVNDSTGWCPRDGVSSGSHEGKRWRARREDRRSSAEWECASCPGGSCGVATRESGSHFPGCLSPLTCRNGALIGGGGEELSLASSPLPRCCRRTSSRYGARAAAYGLGDQYGIHGEGGRRVRERESARLVPSCNGPPAGRHSTRRLLGQVTLPGLVGEALLTGGCDS
jgi:hypothetical protein